MATSDLLGDADDSVSLRVGGDYLVAPESYDVAVDVLTQPAAWSMRIGDGTVARELLASYPPNSPFELRIGNAQQQVGATDEIGATLNGNATEVTIKGRDALAPLHDSHVAQEQTFQDVTYADLVLKAFTACGMHDATLVHTNAANRSVRAGIPVVELAPALTSYDVILEEATGQGTKHLEIRAKVGERWYDVVRRHLDRAGLFLWSAADGTFVLSAPNGAQEPAYTIRRALGGKSNAVDLVDASFVNNTTGRHAAYIATGRGGGGSTQRARVEGIYVDPEMEAWGFAKVISFHDVNAKTPKQAEFWARRKCAEARRAGWRLEYTIAGHTLPTATGRRAVVTPDTVMRVDDDEFGLHGNFYVEGVRYARSGGGTTTAVRLMRVDDLIFGADS